MFKKAVLMGFVNFQGVLRSRNGQAMTEYGLIIALIAVVVITAIALLGGRIRDAVMTIVNELG